MNDFQIGFNLFWEYLPFFAGAFAGFLVFCMITMLVYFCTYCILERIMR